MNSSFPLVNAELSPLNYLFLQKYVYSSSGIVLDENKRYLVEARLLPLVRQAGLASLNALCELMLRKPSDPVGRLVVDAMTTNETLFFRDANLFETLRLQILPALFARAGKRKVRIWSAAASTGQEAYSLAMLLLEAGHTQADVEIVGTDISHRVIERARAGIYNKFELERGVSPALQARYFAVCEGGWQMRDVARRMTRFEQLDLRGELRSLGCFDLVLCRNVLIYFDLATKQQILTNLLSTFHDGALLSLGVSETSINIHRELGREMVGQYVFYSRSATGARRT